MPYSRAMANRLTDVSPLTRWRIARGFTQNGLAKRVGIAQPTLWELEQSQRAPKGLRTALALAAALEVPVEALWPEVTPQRGPQPQPARRVSRRQQPSPTVAKIRGRAKSGEKA